MAKRKKSSTRNKTRIDTAIVVALISVAGTIIAALLSNPVLTKRIETSTVTDTPTTLTITVISPSPKVLLTKARSFKASSENDTFFSVIGTLEGTYTVANNKLIVYIQRGELRYLDRPNSLDKPEVILQTIYAGLAFINPDNRWEIFRESKPELLGKNVSIGDQVSISSLELSIPTDDIDDLGKYWLVFGIAISLPDKSYLAQSFVHDYNHIEP